jgi:hypothetical protein
MDKTKNETHLILRYDRGAEKEKEKTELGKNTKDK